MAVAWTVEDVAEQLRSLGVGAAPALVVHTSFRAVAPERNLDGGPLGLIRALRLAAGPGTTLVMPTMTDGESVFDPRTTPTLDMGIVAETFWRQPGVVRSSHPGGSFAAEGPDAEYICKPQPLSPPHGVDSPVGRVHHLGGEVLLLGVTHSENTTLHLAEAIAQVPYSVSHPCVVDTRGGPKVVMIPETDHCCRGFRRLDEWLRAAELQREGTVGSAETRLVRSKDVVDVAVKHLEEDPLVFLCAEGAGCEECDVARRSVNRRG